MWAVSREGRYLNDVGMLVLRCSLWDVNYEMLVVTYTGVLNVGF